MLWAYPERCLAVEESVAPLLLFRALGLFFGCFFAVITWDFEWSLLMRRDDWGVALSLENYRFMI